MIVLFSLGCCIWFDFNRAFVTRATAHLAETYPVVDGWMLYSATPTRGVFLKFDGFGAKDVGYAQNIYFRGVYVLYPRPLLVSSPGARINDGFDILKFNWYPSDRWLLDHGVGSVLTIVMDRQKGLPVAEGLRRLEN